MIIRLSNQKKPAPTPKIDRRRRPLSSLYRTQSPSAAPVLNELQIARRIRGLVAKHFNLPVYLLIGDRRTKHIVRARELGMWLTHHGANLLDHDIGKLYRKDRTTVIDACQRVELRHKIDSDFETLCANLLEQAKMIR